MTHYYAVRIMLWRNDWPDEAMIYANSSHCIPDRFDELPDEPISMDELLEYGSRIMEERQKHGEYDGALIFNINGGNQTEVKSEHTFDILYKNRYTDNPGIPKGELLEAIRKKNG